MRAGWAVAALAASGCHLVFGHAPPGPANDGTTTALDVASFRDQLSRERAVDKPPGPRQEIWPVDTLPIDSRRDVQPTPDVCACAPEDKCTPVFDSHVCVAPDGMMPPCGAKASVAWSSPAHPLMVVCEGSLVNQCDAAQALCAGGWKLCDRTRYNKAFSSRTSDCSACGRGVDVVRRSVATFARCGPLYSGLSWGPCARARRVAGGAGWGRPIKPAA